MKQNKNNENVPSEMTNWQSFRFKDFFILFFFVSVISGHRNNDCFFPLSPIAYDDNNNDDGDAFCSRKQLFFSFVHYFKKNYFGFH